MITYLLTLLILPIFLYAFRAWRVSRLVSSSLVMGATVAVSFVWTPALANALASFMGVGRGADLVIYVYCLLSFILILDLSLKLKAQHQVVTRLAREIALRDLAKLGEGGAP
ncbi:MAG: hypothetical protein DDT26_01395 [Dehalococcoidia bacterium]|nr:hypothetical protein [Chloroflexota bacterium]